MNKVLLVGENPTGPTGNGLFLRSILPQIDVTAVDVSVFCPFSDFTPDLSISNSLRVIPSDDLKRQDLWGTQKLLAVLDSNELDFVVFVGIDIWRYIEIIPHIKQIQRKRKFRLIHIFPYDLQYLDNEFVQYSNLMDIPCVYSQYGFDMLKDHIPNLQYFRPPMYGKELFYPYDDEKRQEVRSTIFPTVSPDTFIFGFIGPNQIRKDPQKLIKAFSLLKNKIDKKIVLYMHTNFKDGVFNLQKYAIQCGLDSGDLLVKPEGTYSPFEKMPDIYNAIDCLVNCSMQEGLSWTVIQAMLCKTPVIASDSTAHIELLFGCGGLVPCIATNYIPIKTSQGQSWIDARSCNEYGIELAMNFMVKATKEQKQFTDVGLQKINKWFEGCSNVSDLFEKQAISETKPLQSAILFVQHSAAGDILMSTRCLKGIRNKHDNVPLHYMTQKQYHGILKNNPDIDKVLDWNPDLAKEYQFVYNPHGERILPGNFNSLDVPLYAMYPYFCKVEMGEAFIQCDKPEIELPKEPYIIVHSTGGDPKYRTYNHMGLVIKGLILPVVQIGLKTDLYVPGAIDLRGILSFTETAYVMRECLAAIVIDSFPSHLAGVFNKPTIVLYGPAPARVVRPFRVVKESLWFDLEPNKLEVCQNCGSCYGRRECSSPCINSINPLAVKRILIGMLEELLSGGDK